MPFAITFYMSVLICKNISIEGPGTIEDFLNENGIPSTIVDLSRGEAIPDTDRFTTLVMMGGPMSVNEDDRYPYIKKEEELVRDFAAKDKRILGICLGAQMIAKSLCARVYHGPQKEIGWAPLMLTEEGARSPLAEVAPDKTPVLHWHGDTFDLPEGAVRLASTPLYVNQAFAYGQRTLALQFHPEVTVRGMERWFIGHTGEIARTEGISVPGLREATRTQGPILEAHSPRFFRAWLRSVGL